MACFEIKMGDESGVLIVEFYDDRSGVLLPCMDEWHLPGPPSALVSAIRNRPLLADATHTYLEANRLAIVDQPAALSHLIIQPVESALIGQKLRLVIFFGVAGSLVVIWQSKHGSW